MRSSASSLPHVRSLSLGAGAALAGRGVSTRLPDFALAGAGFLTAATTSKISTVLYLCLQRRHSRNRLVVSLCGRLDRTLLLPLHFGQFMLFILCQLPPATAITSKTPAKIAPACTSLALCDCFPANRRAAVQAEQFSHPGPHIAGAVSSPARYRVASLRALDKPQRGSSALLSRNTHRNNANALGCLFD